jgi:enoyl-CoA hydratase
MMDELNDHLTAAAKTDVRCVVLTGCEGVFASGGDLKQMAVRTLQSVQKENTLCEWDRVSRFPRLLLAAVNGFALGGGLQLAMMCDIRFAGKSAKFGHPELSIGTLPGAGGTQRLTRLVGKTRAMDMICTGKIITAAEAYDYGLVSRLCEDDKLESEAFEFAGNVGEMPLEYILNLKASLR